MRLALHVAAHNPYRAGREPVQPGNGGNQRGFACAVVAEQGKKFAPCHVKRNIADGLETVLIAFAGIGDMEGGVGHAAAFAGNEDGWAGKVQAAFGQSKSSLHS